MVWIYFLDTYYVPDIPLATLYTLLFNFVFTKFMSGEDYYDPIVIDEA